MFSNLSDFVISITVICCPYLLFLTNAVSNSYSCSLYPAILLFLRYTKHLEVEIVPETFWQNSCFVSYDHKTNCVCFKTFLWGKQHILICSNLRTKLNYFVFSLLIVLNPASGLLFMIWDSISFLQKFSNLLSRRPESSHILATVCADLHGVMWESSIQRKAFVLPDKKETDHSCISARFLYITAGGYLCIVYHIVWTGFGSFDYWILSKVLGWLNIPLQCMSCSK